MEMACYRRRAFWASFPIQALQPLYIHEMERAMGYPAGFTQAAGCSHDARYRL
jgi:hypothetical protein